MLKKFSILTAGIVALVVVLVTIAHACAGMSALSMSPQVAMEIEASDNLPCSNRDNDLCESVRDSLLSVKPSSSGSDSLVVARLPLSVVIPSVQTSPPNLLRAAFHPVFKLSLSFSYLVLRI